MRRIYSIHGWLFVLHRVTGIALLVYLIAHILTISTAMIAGPRAFTSVMATLARPAFAAVELAIVGCVAFHGLNGIRIIAVERGWLKSGGTAFAGATIATTLAVWLAAAALVVAR